MNRFVQKLIAGAVAVAIAVTGLVGGASVAKAADPTTGTITISNASGDTVASMIVARFVEGKDWFQKKQAERAEKAGA